MFSIYNVMSSVNNDSFTFSFPIWMPFLSSFCVITVARISSTMLNKRGESRHSCFVFDLKGNDFNFCPLSVVLAASHRFYVVCSFSFFSR